MACKDKKEIEDEEFVKKLKELRDKFLNDQISREEFEKQKDNMVAAQLRLV